MARLCLQMLYRVEGTDDVEAIAYYRNQLVLIQGQQVCPLHNLQCLDIFLAKYRAPLSLGTYMLVQSVDLYNSKCIKRSV